MARLITVDLEKASFQYDVSSGRVDVIFNDGDSFVTLKMSAEKAERLGVDLRALSAKIISVRNNSEYALIGVSPAVAKAVA